MNNVGRVIVCEQRGRWASLLRAEACLPILQTRGLDACWEKLSQAPASFVAVELREANVEELLRRLAWLQRDFPFARLAVVSDRRWAGYQWLMREAGAIHFLCSPRHAPALAQLAKRHLDGLPAPSKSRQELIWDALPWKQAQTPVG